jgi:hypothetical protein
VGEGAGRRSAAERWGGDAGGTFTAATEIAAG